MGLLKKSTWMVWMVIGLVGFPMASAPALEVMESARDPIAVQTQTVLDSRTSAVGDRFEGVLVEDYQYQQAILPAGTRFQGLVSDVKRSRRFARPASLEITVQQVVLPSGETHQMSLLQGLGGARSRKLHRDNARTLNRFVVTSVPAQSASLGTSLPLTLATELDNWVVLPIAYGARLATAAAVEVAATPDQGRSLPRQVAEGLWRGTGVPGVYEFLTVDKPVHFDAGSMVPLQLPPDAVNGMFMLNSLVRVPSTRPDQLPAATVAPPLKEAVQDAPTQQVSPSESSQLSPVPPAPDDAP